MGQRLTLFTTVIPIGPSGLLPIPPKTRSRSVKNAAGTGLKMFYPSFSADLSGKSGGRTTGFSDKNLFTGESKTAFPIGGDHVPARQFYYKA